MLVGCFVRIKTPLQPPEMKCDCQKSTSFDAGLWGISPGLVMLSPSMPEAMVKKIGLSIGLDPVDGYLICDRIDIEVVAITVTVLH